MRYCLCCLLLLQEEVQVHMAPCLLGQNRTTHCHCYVLAYYGDTTSSGKLLKRLRCWLPSPLNIPRRTLLVRVAPIPHHSDPNILILLRLYLMHSDTRPLLTKNDHKQTHSTAELHRVSSIHHKQNNMSIHI